MRLKQFLFAFVAMLASFSVTAFAGDVIVVHNEAELRAALEGGGTQNVASQKQRFTLGTTLRTTTLAAESDANIIQFGEDITLTAPMQTNVGSNTVINLAGHYIKGAEIDGTSKHEYPFYNRGTMRIQDEVGGGYIDCGVYNGYDLDGDRYEAAKLEMVSGRIVCHDDEGAAIINYGVAIISGGTVEGSVNALWNVAGNMTVTEGVNVTGGIKGEVSISEGVNYTVAKIGDESFASFSDALDKAKFAISHVTVQILGEVEFIDGMELKDGTFTSISFVGKGAKAKITINQTAGGDYLEAHGKTVNFTDLTLAKANPKWSGNSGHMGNYFSIQGGTVTYTNCTFLNGACTSGGTATYTGCTFQNASEYGLWVYDDALVTVNGGTVNSAKGIKVYSEDEKSVTSTLTVKNATFTENVTEKPAVAIGYAESITLIGNTYNNAKGVLELDSGSDADCEGVTFVAQDKYGNDISSTITATDRSNSDAACGVLVDGKIYTTVTEAAKETEAGDTVTLLYSSTETVALPIGTVLNKNGKTADGVTVTQAIAKIGDVEYASLQAAIDAVKNGDEIILVADCDEAIAFTQTKDVSFVLNGNDKTMTGSINITARAGKDAPSTLVIKNFNFETDEISHDFINSAERNYYPNNITIQDCKFKGTSDISTEGYAVVAVRLKSANNITIKDCTGTGLHSFLQNTAGWNLTIDNVTVDAAEGGFALGTVQGVTVKNCEINNGRYGIRLDAGYNNNAVIADNKINNTFIPVVVRYATVDGNITFSGTNNFTATNTDKLWCAIGTSEYKENGVLPDAATGRVKVTLNDTGLNAEGLYGNFVPTAKIGEAEYATLADAIAAVKNGETITLVAGVEEDVTVVQAPDVAFTIDGNDNTFKGTITVDGKSAAYATAGVTVKNIKFLADGITKDACINLGGNNNIRYTSNVTVDGCTFTDTDNTAVGIKSYTGGDKNLTVTNCTATKMHSLMQLKNVAGVNVANCTIEDSKNGIALGVSSNVAVTETTMDCEGYGVRADANAAANATITDCNISAFIPVVVRNASADYNLTFAGDNTMKEGNTDGLWCAIGKSEYEANGTMPTAATGKVKVTLNEEDTDLDIAGVYGNFGVASIGNVNYMSFAAALDAVKDGETVNLHWTAGDAPISMAGTVCGNKTVTITGTADVDWSKGFFFVGRGGEGDGKVIFNNAHLTSVSNSSAYGFNVSGSKAGDNQTNNGAVELVNSTIVLDYMLNKGTMSLDNSALTVKNGFSVTGRKASESATGEDATATMTLANNSKVVVNNYNGMGIGHEAYGVMNIDATSSFEATQNFAVAANGTMNIAGKASVAVELTNNGAINLTAKDATLATPTAGLTVNTDVADYKVAYIEKVYKLVEKDYIAQVGDQKFEVFAEALDAVNDCETITLLGGAFDESAKEIDFQKSISFTITGVAPDAKLPIITFQNAKVTIKDAKFQIPELDARQNATINVDNSTIVDAGGNSIVKSYYNGKINITNNSTVYAMQVTTMGYINIDETSTLNATWQTNVYGNGMITLSEGAKFNTAALHLTAQDYSGRDNTDADRVGKPATIVVDGADFTVGKVLSAGGADYSYNSSKGVNVGTIDGKNAILDIKNDANVNIYMANGETANFGAGATVNVEASTLNVLCRAADGVATLANAGTVNVSGESNLAAAKVTGDGWFYMNGVTLGADTKLLGAKVAFINGENTVKGSTIKDGFFSVGIGQNAAATTAAAFAQANGIELGNVTVNVSENANIGGNGEAYSGWVGSAYSADKTQHTYALNVENSQAAFGYMHVSKDGTLTVDGRSAENNRYTYDNANVNFYAGDFIVNGTVTLNNADAWVKYTKMSVDHVDGVLNINGDTKYESSIHNGSNTGTSLVYYKSGKVNVAETAIVEIDNATNFVDGAELNIAGNVTAKGAITGNGAINFTNDAATLTTATTGLTIGYNLNADKKVVYTEGAYKVAEKLYVAQIGDAKYETLAAAVAAVEDGGTITMIANETFTENNRYDNGGWWDGLGYSGDKSFTIDLGGFTVSQNGALNDYLIWLKNDGAKANTITLKNGTLDAGTSAYCALATASSNAQKITVNLEDINLINNNSNGATLKIRGGAELNANAGTIITGKNSYVGIEAVGSKTVVNIYEGAEIYQNGTSSYCGCLAGVSGNGTINVYGGEGQSKSGGFIAMTSGGTINIEGGEWTANTDGSYANSNKSVLVAQSENGAKSIVNVTGGTFKGGYNCYGNAAGDAQINIKGGNFNANPTSYVADGYVAVENNGVWTVEQAAVKVGDTYYASLEAGLKALTNGATLTFLEDITVTEAWDERYTGGRISANNVTIDGNGKTVTFACDIQDGANYCAPFRIEGASATFKNLTIDMSQATNSKFNRLRAISSNATDLTVTNCEFIGSETITNSRAIIFGEGSQNIPETDINISECTFKNWRYGVTDNENGKDVGNVTVTGNIFENSSVQISASSKVVFDKNTLTDGGVIITSYTNVEGVSVQAVNNTLDADETNKITTNPANHWISGEGFSTPVAKMGGKYYVSIQDAVDASTGSEITLTVNKYLTLDEAVVIENKDVTLNLNGKTVRAAADAKMTGGIFRLLDDANFTITGAGEITNNGNANVIAAVGVLGAANLTVESGKLVGYYYGITGNGMKDGSTVTINGGEIVSIEGTGSGIYNPQNGTLNVTGGTISGATGIYFKSGKLSITGGTINGTGAKKDYNHSGNGSDATGDALVIENVAAGNYQAIESVSITGGTFNSVNADPIASYAADGATALTEFVTNGTFNKKFSEECLPVGYQLISNDGGSTYGVAKTDKRESMTIVDGEYTEFSIETPIEVGTLTYKRTFSNVGGWNALYVPFEIPVEAFGDGYKVAYVNDIRSFDANDNGVIETDELTMEGIYIKNGTLRANHPYVIIPQNEEAKELELVLNDVKVCTKDPITVDFSSAYVKYFVKGTYVKGGKAELNNGGDFFALINGTWAKASDTAKLGAFRIYFTMENKNGSPVVIAEDAEIRVRIAGEEDQVTGIFTPYVSESFVKEGIFDLMGRPVATPEKGKIYIIDGKKVLY